MGLASSSSNFGPGIALQYKYWAKDAKALRANIGYTKAIYSNGRVYFPAQGDAVFSKIAVTEIPALQVAIGIEKQRHFYKRLYMYASIDLYA